MRAPSSIVITGASIARHAACAGGSSTPVSASRSAGPTTRGHGSRPCAAHSATTPAGSPGPTPDTGPTARRATAAPHATQRRAAPAAITAGSLQNVNAATELPLVHARCLIKQFGDLTAVDAIDFGVQQGAAFGFLGPNGVGKSSTVGMVGCVSPPSGGTLRVLGL